MKNEPCEKYSELIEQYSCGEMNPGDSKILLEHIQQCPGCRAYLDTIKDLDRKTAEWARMLDPLIKAGQSRAVEQLYLMPEPAARKPGLLLSRWRSAGYAAAACILVIFGFLAGHGLRPSADVNHEQMQARITAAVLKSLRPDITEEYLKMQDALSGQISLELKSHAEQIAKYNDIQVCQLLTGLIKAIQTAQVQNQQWALSAMAEIEGNRIRDQQEVHNQMAVLAAYTGKELYRTQHAIKTLSAKQK